MRQYLHDAEDAATRLIEGIYHEATLIEELRARIRTLLVEVHDAQDKADFLALNPDLDDERLGTANRWSSHFGQSEMRSVHDQIREVEQASANRLVSINALASALLQIAKQGISLHGGGRNGSPPWRCIGSQSLRNVTWEARNQAMHFEEGSPRQPVRDCFAALERDFRANFSLSNFPHTNLAFEVVHLLGWNSFQTFANDLGSL